MTQYIEKQRSRPVLPPKRAESNTLFIASYPLAPYGGCEFGCAYCDAWAFHHTPLNTAIQVYTDFPQRLARELPDISAGEVFGLIRGEPYQPVENQYRLTRQVLNVLRDQRRPVVICTKSPAVCEDIPVLTEIHQSTFAVVAISLVTLDPLLSKHLEKQTPSPQRRLDALATLKQAGIPCGVAMIPGIDSIRCCHFRGEAIGSNLNFQMVLYSGAASTRGNSV